MTTFNSKHFGEVHRVWAQDVAYPIDYWVENDEGCEIWIKGTGEVVAVFNM